MRDSGVREREKEKERGGEREREKQRGGERERETESACVDLDGAAAGGLMNLKKLNAFPQIKCIFFHFATNRIFRLFPGQKKGMDK
jgi:hypothetical protein